MGNATAHLVKAIQLGANGVNIQHVAEERRKKLGHVKVESPVKELASGRQRSPKIVIKNHAQFGMIGVNGLNVVKAVEEEVGEKVEHVNSENLIKLAAPEKQMLPKPVMKKPVQPRNLIALTLILSPITMEISAVNQFLCLIVLEINLTPGLQAT